MRSKKSPPKDDGTTRERLLEAAAKTFADRGFRAATVREICRRAGANVAAVNYHFGTKEALELEAARWCVSRIGCGEDGEPAGGAPAADLPSAIRAIARSVFGAREEWETRLMLRAVSEPNPSLEVVVREFIEPRVRRLEASLRPHLPGADERSLRLHAISVVSQMVYHRLAGPVALRLLGERAYTAQIQDEIVEHVTRFTVRSLEAAKREARR